jgi:hypothetical protein
MVVTDVTRMQGDRICVGGYLEDGMSIRPVCERIGPTEAWLRPSRDERVVPFAVICLTVGPPPDLIPPHTEDRVVPATGHRVIETLPQADASALLEWSTSSMVRDIFGADMHADANGPWGRFVHSGEGMRSLGTIQAARILAVRYQYSPDRGRWDYRLRFLDAARDQYQLAIVDLGFRRRLDVMRGDGLAPDRISATTLAALQRQTVYLRIGLARGWERHPDRCYLQITGVYGFDASR